jgi:hypothetical protein
MWFNQEGLEESPIRFNLPLQFIIFFRTKPRLIWIGNHFIQIHLRTICAQDRAIESALLKFERI